VAHFGSHLRQPNGITAPLRPGMSARSVGWHSFIFLGFRKLQ
jgi:hypothetical protein